MYLVALTSVRGTVEAEAPALAEILGVATYDVRLVLNATLPRIVRQSRTAEEALALGDGARRGVRCPA